MSFFIYANEELREELYKAVANPDAFSAADPHFAVQRRHSAAVSRRQQPRAVFSDALPGVGSRVFAITITSSRSTNSRRRCPSGKSWTRATRARFTNVAMIRGNYAEPQPALCVTRVALPCRRNAAGAVEHRWSGLPRLEAAMQPILPETGEYWYRCRLDGGQTLFENGSRARGHDGAERAGRRRRGDAGVRLGAGLRRGADAGAGARVRRVYRGRAGARGGGHRDHVEPRHAPAAAGAEQVRALCAGPRARRRAAGGLGRGRAAGPDVYAALPRILREHSGAAEDAG